MEARDEAAYGILALILVLALYAIVGTVEWHDEQAYMREVSAYEAVRGQ